MTSIPDSFSSYYRSLFPERWEGLASVLLAEEPKVAFSQGLAKPYYMSAASIAVARALLPAGSSSFSGDACILDMCAAPGGKTLVLASSMEEGCSLVANELSAARRRRLSNVLDEHLLPEKRRQVRVTGFDAARWSRRQRECFDFILLDAPCSSERHVISDKKSLSQWSKARVKSLAMRQWALLSGAWLLLKRGGRLVYSTCALTHAENSGVVERLLGKYPDSKPYFPPSDFFAGISAKIQGEASGRGVGIFPDKSCGIGPMFFAVLEKD